MKKGDMVRFRTVIDHRNEILSEWKYGVIAKKYETWEKIVTVLHNGELLRIPARTVQMHQRGYHDR